MGYIVSAQARSLLDYLAFIPGSQPISLILTGRASELTIAKLDIYQL